MTADARLEGDQLIATRHLDAEPALVWETFTTPEHLAAFWGGDHATVPAGSVTVDLRVGGSFTLDTRGPDGSTHSLHFRYERVDPPTRLVLTEPDTGITTAIDFEPTGSGTKVVVRQRRLPPELRTEQARAGLASILDRLQLVVANLATDRRRQTP